MKRSILVFLLFILSVTAFGQKSEQEGPSFDTADFNKKFEVVQWLVEYDNVAWKTSDVVMEQDKKNTERLGREWFCIQGKDKKWHAFYGKLTDGKYEAVFHFVMDADEKITKSAEKFDAELLNKYAAALAASNAKLMSTISEGSPRFNQYIRQNTDKTFTVWMLPAFQTNGMAVYGGEATYFIDPSGAKITREESYFKKGFRGFMAEPPREIWLNYREMEKPSLEAIFFAWYYKNYFTSLKIDNAKFVSTPLRTDDGYMWVHVEKEDEPERSKDAAVEGSAEKPLAVKMFEIGDVSEKEFKRPFSEHPEWKNCDAEYQIFVVNYGPTEQVGKREQAEEETFSGTEGNFCSRRVFVRGDSGAVKTVVWKVPPGADNPIP